MKITGKPLKTILRKLCFLPKDERKGEASSSVAERRVVSASSVAPETNKQSENVLMGCKQVLIGEEKRFESRPTTTTTTDAVEKNNCEKILNLSKDTADRDQQVLDELWRLYFDRVDKAGVGAGASSSSCLQGGRKRYNTFLG